MRNHAPAHVLREYALLADGHRGALVGPAGDISWMCFPLWHDPAVFAAMIGSGGMFQVCAAGRYVWGGHYEQGSLIWNSRWVTESAIIECREALAYPSHRGRATLLRRIRGIEGCGTVEVVLEPARDYGRKTVSSWHRSSGVLETTVAGTTWRLCGADEATAHRDGRIELVVPIESGQHHDLVLEIATAEALNRELPSAKQLWATTERSWARAVSSTPDGLVGARDVRHASAVLHGLTSPSGATVAAITTSLPERADSNRNYDYRYAWIRDVCYVGTAGAAVHAEDLVEPATRFVRDRLLADGAGLMPAYTADGDAVPPQEHLDLAGYPGGSDLVGNHVRDQFQLDAFGEALRLFAAADSLGILDADGWTAAETAAQAIESRWREPDAGIWELDAQLWTHSRLCCSAGLRAMAARPGAPGSRWVALADSILADTARTSLHPSGRWQRSPTDPRVDAALLVPGFTGAVDAADPRTVATYEAVLAELTEDGYIYRYIGREGEPLGTIEGAFLLCSFWMTLAAIGQGDLVGAARWFERGRAGCGPPGLFAEEFDVGQRQLRGNLPQAFVHALLMHAAAAQTEAVA